jgi:hypothetical protein
VKTGARSSALWRIEEQIFAQSMFDEMPKLLQRPHIALLPEQNARQGFFEPEQPLAR